MTKRTFGRIKGLIQDMALWSGRKIIDVFSPNSVLIHNKKTRLPRKDTMNILWICSDNTANNPYNIVKTINDETKHMAVLIQAKQTYLNYPLDGTIMVNTITLKEFIKYVKWADVIHLNESVVSGLYPPEQAARFKCGSRVTLYDVLTEDKKVFRHSNGTYYRSHYGEINRLCEKHNMYKTVSTPDLISYGMHTYWLPQPIPTTDEIYKKGEVMSTEKIRISHSPTNRLIKGTQLFLLVCKKLFPELEVVLIEGKKHDECLRIRKTCHINYDQYSLGAYGVSSLESLAIGQLNIVGLHYVCNYIRDHPFIEIKDGVMTGMATAIQECIDIIHSDGYEKHLETQRKWLVEYHERIKVVEFLLELYKHAGYYVK